MAPWPWPAFQAKALVKNSKRGGNTISLHNTYIKQVYILCLAVNTVECTCKCMRRYSSLSFVQFCAWGFNLTTWFQPGGRSAQFIGYGTYWQCMGLFGWFYSSCLPNDPYFNNCCDFKSMIQFLWTRQLQSHAEGLQLGKKRLQHRGRRLLCREASTQSLRVPMSRRTCLSNIQAKVKEVYFLGWPG